MTSPEQLQAEAVQLEVQLYESVQLEVQEQLEVQLEQLEQLEHFFLWNSFFRKHSFFGVQQLE